jgi:hypothetical protein
MLGEVNLTHATSAEQALNNVASEDLTVVERHARKPTNRHGRGANSADEQENRRVGLSTPSRPETETAGNERR